MMSNNHFQTKTRPARPKTEHQNEIFSLEISRNILGMALARNLLTLVPKFSEPLSNDQMTGV